jgi:hypothetical protein
VITTDFAEKLIESLSRQSMMRLRAVDNDRVSWLEMKSSD